MVVSVTTAQSRRVDYSESTRQALVDSAVALFTQQGYSATSLDAIAKRARVTKGALYHHFSGKQALFEAVFDAVENSVMGRLGEVVTGPGSAWDRAMSGVQAYLKACLEPSYQRIVIHEAPVVMGWERWREAEEHFSYGLVRAALEALIEAGEIDDLPLEVTARVVFGALSTGATIIAGAADPKKAGAEVSVTITRVLEGMRKRTEEERPDAPAAPVRSLRR
ncbi:TetR/AcrR family transcriptional regulator [Actinokineospora iranica]|uniref:DNA-binding transcriptional regulator, AcrR family n=1 Tax=Actinokineospora iranica TaxID=1271860 RepID=A0A1G6MYH8_9PSEU|nr:TetR/AcrR family transcriptional regulator [Actinokineospora iranica]SDC59965.1 DNA-binding transcriptional regulator, AcrR family [Actinokineospora iranica]